MTAVSRAELKGSSGLAIPLGTTTPDAWEMAARVLGLTPTELAYAVAPAVSLAPAAVDRRDPRASRLVPEKLARRFNVLPLSDDDKTLIVATADPFDLNCEQMLAFSAGRRVVFQLAPPHAIAQAVNREYATDRSADAVLANLDPSLLDAVTVVAESQPEAVAAAELSTGPIVQLTNLILRDAVTKRASDVHVEPGDGGGVVRFRIDGVMRQHMALPLPVLNRVVSRIKVASKLDIADRIRPQDGRARISVDGTPYDLRISTVPTRDSEKVVIRILRPGSGGTLVTIGLAARELSRLRHLLGQRDGIVLVTGPTGSGKTTTLYAAIRELATGDINITTVEDPVEYQLAGVSQIQVETKRGVTFASALRAVLRQDPDVIFVGEIRDLETAEIAVQAAMTGHLVLATLHTNDAMSVVPRLVDLGLDRAAIASTVRGAMAQRLMRMLCDECAIEVKGELTDEEARLSAVYGVRPTRRAVGCERCGQTGYFGRLPIDEVALFTPELAEAISRGGSLQVLNGLATAGGMRTLREAAIERVATGASTLAELQRVVGGDGEAAAPTPATGPAVSDETPTIFAVDDDPVQQVAMRTMLEQSGFRVETCAHGRDALTRIVNGDDCALVLTDLHMPKMDGEELVRALRRDARTAGLPVIVLTVSGEPERESALIEAGADDYLQKPVDKTRLIARIRAALRRASQRA